MKIIWRTHTTVILIAGVVVLIIAAALAYMTTRFEPRTSVWFGAMPFQLRLAETEAERIRGLSGVTSLGPNDGLLMVFPEDGHHGIWMKGMKVPLDIIWLNKDKRVIYVVVNASPELGSTQTFSPKDPARYVVELPAGSVKKFNIRDGDIVEFADIEGVQ